MSNCSDLPVELGGVAECPEIQVVPQVMSGQVMPMVNARTGVINGGERGQSLIEVLIGILLLMIVLVPVVGLIDSNAGVVGADRAKAMAEYIAQSQLSQLRGEVSNLNSSSAGYSSFSGELDDLGITPYWYQWNDVSAASVDGASTINYSAYLIGGWCAVDGTTVSAPTSNSNTNDPFTYWVAIKVFWGKPTWEPIDPSMPSGYTAPSYYNSDYVPIAAEAYRQTFHEAVLTAELPTPFPSYVTTMPTLSQISSNVSAGGPWPGNVCPLAVLRGRLPNGGSGS